MAKNNDVLLPYSLNDLFETTPLGSINKQIGNNFYGINRFYDNPLTPKPNFHQGLLFFTRPQLNLSNDNIRAVRQLYPLLNNNPNSLQRAIRALLDPRILEGYTVPGDESGSIPALSCPLIDNDNAFIPILTNNIKSLSGWPDVLFPSFNSKDGLYKESYSQIDGSAKTISSIDFSASFKNTKGEPILLLFYIWGLYTTLVFEGKLVPYPDFVSENEIDYNTRVFRLVLDEYGRKVVKIASTGPGFVEAVGIGQGFDYNTGSPFNESTQELSFRFKFSGVEYFDPILIHEFNETVNIFKPNMKDDIRENVMVRIDNLQTDIFNNRGYPRINPETLDLEFWVDKQYAIERISEFKNKGLISPIKV